MKSKGRTMKSVRVGTTLTVVSLLAVCAGSVSSAAGRARREDGHRSASPPLIPGSTKAATQQFANQVAEFEETGKPSIKAQFRRIPVGPGQRSQRSWPPALCRPCFTVPFTDARALGDNGQLADLTSEAKGLPYFSKYNPAVIAEGTDSKNQVVALPTAAYAQALHYNRKLFAAAGLNPNKPPTTWAQVKADAKLISAKTGMAGYAEMGKDDNTAGWILTTLVYSLGGRMETGTGTKAVATLDNPQTVTALNMLKKMRWTDNSMGSNFDYGWSDINQAFAAGQVGMYVSGSDVYTNLVQASSIDPSIYGLAPIPLAKSKTAGVLGGGTLAAVRPDADAATRAAAVKWIDFYYEQPLINKAQAIRNAKTLTESKQPVGVPALPIFNKTQFTLANSWIKPYVNVPVGQMKPFTTGIFSQKLIPEPEASTQSVYHSLDAVVEDVLTDQNANISQLLQQANSTAQAAIRQGT